ncbi:MAG: inner membrane-spanning protein YciB [Gammaproteobacteria bacterium]
MQMAFVLIPAVLFFGTYKLYDFYVATAVLMASVTLLTLFDWIRTRKANKLHIVSTAMLLIFGSITLVLRDPEFLQWKFSIYHWLIALVLLWTHVFRDKTGVQSFFETIGSLSAGDDESLDLATLPEKKYRNCNLISIIYFTFVGAINLYIAFTMSEEAWVNFKVFGIQIMNFVFMIGLMVYLFKGEFSDRPKSEDNE